MSPFLGEGRRLYFAMQPDEGLVRRTHVAQYMSVQTYVKEPSNTLLERTRDR